MRKATERAVELYSAKDYFKKFEQDEALQSLNPPIKETPQYKVRKQRLTQGRLMNLDRSDAIAKRYFEKESEKRDTRTFYNDVIKELNNKHELMEACKLQKE